MAMHVPQAPGFARMMKDGAQHFQGLEEAVYRNIAACQELARSTRTAYGPNGMNKMVINHLQKLFVTNDAATILKELEVQHPAAKMLVMASQMQEQEVGDATNWVMIFAGELLANAEELLRVGLSPTEVAAGYNLAAARAAEILPDLVCGSVTNVRDCAEMSRAIRPCIMSKQYGLEDFLSQLIAEACSTIMPETSAFNVDSVRVCKVLGAGVPASSIVNGMVFKRTVEGDTVVAADAKIVVYTCPLDIGTTETKGTVLIKSADELQGFSRGEENVLEQQIKAIADTGAKIIVSGGKIGDMALHFVNKYKLMAVRLLSKFDIRRLCRSVGATALPRLVPPTAEEMGRVQRAYVDEIGGTSVVVFQQSGVEGAVSTVVVRGSTDNIMDDVERCIDDGINTFKAYCRDPRYVPGAGATEIELARQLTEYADTCPGLEQYAIKKFGEALEVFPKILAENAGVKSTEALSMLYASHQEGKKNSGFDIEGEGAAIMDVAAAGIVDTFLSRHWGLRFATSAAVTVLQVDQIIMAKQAGGPKPKKNEDWDED